MANRLSNTDYFISSGSWRVNEDADTGERYIECVAAGVISRRNLEAYGTWEFTMRRGAAGNYPRFGFASSAAADPTTTPGTYYLIFDGIPVEGRIRLYEAGVGPLVTTAVGFIDSGVAYDFRITRSASGVFVCYVKGGSFTDWVDFGTGTDNTTTTSQYFVADLDAGDRLYLDRQYAGVVTP